MLCPDFSAGPARTAAMWLTADAQSASRQRPLRPTSRRSAPRFECPLESKYRTLIVLVHAGADRCQISPPFNAARFLRGYSAGKQFAAGAGCWLRTAAISRAPRANWACIAAPAKEITEKTCRGHAQRLASTAAPSVEQNRRPPETGHLAPVKGRCASVRVQEMRAFA